MRSGRFFPLSDEVLELLEKLAKARGKSREAVLEEEIRRAAAESGLDVPEEGAFLELQAVEETPAIGPEGRGRKIRLKAVDETGEQDLGELFLPDEGSGKKGPKE
jgi:predicted transcriptional regulator